MGGCKLRETFLHGFQFTPQVGLFITKGLGFIRRGAGSCGPSITERAIRPGSEAPAGSPAEPAPAKAPGAAAGTTTPELATATTAAGSTGTEAPAGARSLSHRSSSIKTWHGHYLLCPSAVGQASFATVACRGSPIFHISEGECLVSPRLKNPESCQHSPGPRHPGGNSPIRPGIPCSGRRTPRVYP